MNTTQHAIYTIDQSKLHPTGTVTSASPLGDTPSAFHPSSAEEHTHGLSPLLSASGKAVLRTHKALVRGTSRLYHRVQRDFTVESFSFTLKSRPLDPTRQPMDKNTERRRTETEGLTYVPGWSAKAALPDGTGFILRPLLEEDRERLEEGFERLSPASRYQRFMTSMETLPEHYLHYLTHIDYRNHFAVTAAIEDPVRFELQGLGIARFITLEDNKDEAELAITIVDDAQGRGLGVILMDVLLRAAQERGLSALRAEVLPTNDGMQSLAKRFGGTQIAAHDGLVTWRIPVPAQGQLPEPTYLQTNDA